MKRTQNIWKSFFSLSVGQSFYITRKKLAVKAGFCSYTEYDPGATRAPVYWFTDSLKRIAPWRRVRTLIPVTTTEKYWPRAKDCLGPTGAAYIDGPCVTGGSGQTHYVGDSCPGGHLGDSPTTGCASSQALRDPMDQDHSPQPQPEHDRTL